MKQMKQTKWLVLVCGIILLGAALTGMLLPKRPKENPIDAAIEKERVNVTETAPEVSLEPEIYRSPVDFDALQKVNPDICAWLDIPGTDISYPILLREGENAFYLSHGENGEPSSAGALFMEDYNSRDFTDPAIAVYGHQLRSGAYFGNLQEIFETAEGFQAHPECLVYLPDRMIRFQIFGAVPYNDTHLLYTYHFGNQYEYYNFLDRVKEVRSFSAHLREEALPVYGDQLLILSTCLRTDSTCRYLVLGKAVEE